MYTGTDGKFRGGAALTWGALAEMAGNLLHEDAAGEYPEPGAAVTRAGLAKAGRAAFIIWEQQHPEEPEQPEQ